MKGSLPEAEALTLGYPELLNGPIFFFSALITAWTSGPVEII